MHVASPHGRRLCAQPALRRGTQRGGLGATRPDGDAGAAAAADGRADNPFESCLRAIALDVPGWSPQAQPHVPGVGHADVGEAAARLVLEAESFEFHALPEAFAYDLRRYTAMVRAGWVVLRFGWDELMHRPDEVRATIEAVLRRQQRAVRACPRWSAA